MMSVEFADATLHLSAEYLRVYSPSAEVRGHGPDQRQLVTGKKQVAIESIETVGNYAVRITFDDGHDTGLYTWDYLRELAANESTWWADYERELKAANASRLPQIPLGQVGNWTPPERDA